MGFAVYRKRFEFMVCKMRQEMRDEHCIYLPQCRDVAFDVYMFKITPKLQQVLPKPYAPLLTQARR